MRFKEYILDVDWEGYIEDEIEPELESEFDKSDPVEEVRNYGNYAIMVLNLKWPSGEAGSILSRVDDIIEEFADKEGFTFGMNDVDEERRVATWKLQV